MQPVKGIANKGFSPPTRMEKGNRSVVEEKGEVAPQSGTRQGFVGTWGQKSAFEITRDQKEAWILTGTSVALLDVWF